eukprot:CAMPEP_0197026668 /NCGR_PEP_ID=MMETSP1384-20130603/6712_1 /TAXON_ID=29189 /ORGANISM="Ammonia sp." /LENGTH=238 /DNA_ID=CAMNT_0042455373 /DNA_START=68 /DNA_END=784 /DNA_ORIENTATION=-
MPKTTPKAMRFIQPAIPRRLPPLKIPENSAQMLLVRDRESPFDWKCLPMPRDVFVMIEPNHHRPCMRANICFRQYMLTISGPLGTIRRKLCGDIALIQNGQFMTQQFRWRSDRERKMQSMTTAKVLKNAVYGVSCGWEKRMRLFGKGFRASIDVNDERKLIMRCGYARPMVLTAPIGISWHVLEPDDTGYPIVVRGIDLEQVGNVCAGLRRAKKMNLQGQGVRYDGEIRRIRTKKGKR